MSDHETDFQRAYDTLIEQMPDPPSYERITARGLTPAARARSIWPTAVVVTGLVLVLTGGVALLLKEGWSPPGDDPGIVPVTTGADTTLQPEPPATQSVFSEATGAVLVFDDGLAGIISLDLDDGRVERRPLDGQRAGDPNYRLLRVGNSLVVGWGEIHALPVDTLEGGLLGRATIFIPAVELDTVWLIDYPGGRIGQGTPTYRQVRLDGDEIVSAAGLDPAMVYPAHGIPGGIVHETDSGITIWYPDAETVRIPGSGPGFVADVSDDLIAWCEGECTLHLTEIGGGDTVVPSPGPDRSFEPRSARFSPDGRLLAVVIGDPGPIGPDSTGAIAVIDVASGEATVVTGPLLPRPSYIGWSPDGRHLFFSSYSYGQSEMLIGWYRVTDGHLEIVTPPIGGALSFVILDRDEASAFFSAQ